MQLTLCCRSILHVHCRRRQHLFDVLVSGPSRTELRRHPEASKSKQSEYNLFGEAKHTFTVGATMDKPTHIISVCNIDSVLLQRTANTNCELQLELGFAATWYHSNQPLFTFTTTAFRYYIYSQD